MNDLLSEYLHSRCFDIPQNWFDNHYTTTFALGALKTPNISQPCGARGAAVHAYGAMRSDTRAATNLKLISIVDSEDRYFTETASSVQSLILYDCDAEALSKSICPGQLYSLMIKWRYCPELVQFHGFISVVVLLDTPPGSPKNCPEAKGGSVRVQISLLKPVSFYMVKPMFCPSRDQSSPVKSSIGFWLSPLRSISRFSPRTVRVGLCEFHLEFRVVEFHLELREDRVAYRVECSRCYMVESLGLFMAPDSV
ncbi:hypothetical protein F2Q70_00036843 [Brassica cretica]|uniref:Uncharacterized protein n=1 Tax=Brassica cretica TaxID=69181 RepID=A0A8S9JQL9_BRACR|nr:hypothetical protein F2Q70_00036843 [Brassica cretica]